MLTSFLLIVVHIFSAAGPDLTSASRESYTVLVTRALSNNRLLILPVNCQPVPWGLYGTAIWQRMKTFEGRESPGIVVGVPIEGCLYWLDFSPAATEQEILDGVARLRQSLPTQSHVLPQLIGDRVDRAPPLQSYIRSAPAVRSC